MKNEKLTYNLEQLVLAVAESLVGEGQRERRIKG
jgi:hypothetical protein